GFGSLFFPGGRQFILQLTAVSIQSCPEPALREVWTQHGAQAFTFAVLETLKKGEDQTEADYAEDLRLLLAMWREKTEQDGPPPSGADAMRRKGIPTGADNPP
ncbi:MAG TPA: GIY-YIG nuclease family protein, partial [Candidatus Limiplasma sp.]|nr:GIY-YIG nuclease family protein [Candidatus Limiplasma sp.]